MNLTNHSNVLLMYSSPTLWSTRDEVLFYVINEEEKVKMTCAKEFRPVDNDLVLQQVGHRDHGDKNCRRKEAAASGNDHGPG
jgi:hypothetical protein